LEVDPDAGDDLAVVLLVPFGVTTVAAEAATGNPPARRAGKRRAKPAFSAKSGV